MNGLRLIAGVLEATRDVHTPRALARAIASALAPHVSFRRLELHAIDAIVELDHGEWRTIDAAREATATLLAPGLAVVLTGSLPAAIATSELRDVLGGIVDTATRHLEVVQRVATLSRRAHAASRELRADLERLEPRTEVIARSSAMRDALSRAQLVAMHPTTVLITGESGTGKEVLAREIHRRSPRAHRPMLHLNCGALPDTLIESELFGHERGAFTGADRAHAGLFESAHRGTLFLDEVGELSPAAQAKLLRVLQERQLRRVGGTAQIDVDVRLIAATNRSLSAMVANGTFRDDLYYRLDVFAIRVPALRDRRGDLAPLANAIAGELAAKLGIAVPPMTRATLSKLDAHPWPGNVRELMNVLETALILGGGRSFELPEQLARPAAPTTGPHFESAVRAAIERSLRATSGKIYGRDGAAAQLGLKPGTLQSKMRKLGIDRRSFVAPR
nr:sigma 54-interacting transcriptional regulator [Kofleriaceae bacterium]